MNSTQKKEILKGEANKAIKKIKGKDLGKEHKKQIRNFIAKETTKEKRTELKVDLYNGVKNLAKEAKKIYKEEKDQSPETIHKKAEAEFNKEIIAQKKVINLMPDGERKLEEIKELNKKIKAPRVAKNLESNKQKKGKRESFWESLGIARIGVTSGFVIGAAAATGIAASGGTLLAAVASIPIAIGAGYVVGAAIKKTGVNFLDPAINTLKKLPKIIKEKMLNLNARNAKKNVKEFAKPQEKVAQKSLAEPKNKIVNLTSTQNKLNKHKPILKSTKKRAAPIGPKKKTKIKV